ncbi:MAG: hypothetical protein WKF31_05505 [Thermoleophilaceae bacterium]
MSVEAAAERELARVPDWLWDGVDAPVPVEAIADSHFGLLVDEGTDLAALAALSGGDGGPGGTVSGLLLPDRKEIWVDAGEAARAPGRRRFTIAHEIGHWVLHCLHGAAGTGRPVHCRATEVREGVRPTGPRPTARPSRPVPACGRPAATRRPSSRPMGSPPRCSCRRRWSSASTSA